MKTKSKMKGPRKGGRAAASKPKRNPPGMLKASKSSKRLG